MKEKLSNIKFEDDGYFSKHKPFDDVQHLEPYPLITSKHMDLKLKGFKYKMSKNGILTFKACSLTHNRIVSRCGSDTWVFPELSFNTKHLNPEKAYNIYAICSKETNSGTWYLEEDYLKNFSETDYNFKIGVLYHEQDGLRYVEFATNIFPFTSIEFEDGKIIMTTDSLVYEEDDELGYYGCPKITIAAEPIKTSRINPHSHYNNDNGSLYRVAEQLGLNAYEFDILKRIARCRKKGQFEQDLQKIKDTVDLYLKEHTI